MKMTHVLSVFFAILASVLSALPALALDFRGREIIAPPEVLSLYPESVAKARDATRPGPVAGIQILIAADLAGAAGGDPVTAQEAFRITQEPNGAITVALASPRAAPLALATIERTALEGVLYARTGQIERPAMRTRGAHVMVRRLDEQQLVRVIDVVRRSRFNLLVLNVGEGVKWDTLPQRAYLPKAIDKAALNRVLRYASGSGLELVLSAKLLSHQEKLLKNTRPELLYNSTTMNPGNPATMAFQKALMDEIVASTGVRRFNIAHDEVTGVRKKAKAGEAVLPAHLFYQNIRELAAHNSARGVETWMWADMLLIPEMFPEMRQGHLHARGEYRTAAMVESLPPNIVMMSWHYRDEAINYPALSYLADKGHRVLGATWRFEPALRNMTNYVLRGDPRIEGMIATSWYNAHQRFDTVASIFRSSGDTYWDGGFTGWRTDPAARPTKFGKDPRVKGKDRR